MANNTIILSLEAIKMVDTFKFKRMVNFVNKRYPKADPIFKAKKLLFLAENQTYKEVKE